MINLFRLDSEIQQRSEIAPTPKPAICIPLESDPFTVIADYEQHQMEELLAGSEERAKKMLSNSKLLQRVFENS